jgi:hypothetical protein
MKDKELLEQMYLVQKWLDGEYGHLSSESIEIPKCQIGLTTDYKILLIEGIVIWDSRKEPEFPHCVPKEFCFLEKVRLTYLKEVAKLVCSE